MSKLKSYIDDFVNDHWKWFGFYPMEVEIDNKVYTWEEYWIILGAEDE